MRRLIPSDHPDLLVGPETGDDAAVWKISPDRALIATADFITPVVDDARVWGRVAAANSVSDVYAMGGTPLFALNLVGWNTDELSSELLLEVLSGGSDIATEGGFVVAGGHTIDDPEPKYGMSVVGEVHPDRILTNTGLLAGQDLILTKPLGVGVVTTAIKNDRASAKSAEAAIESMSQLNAAASAAALEAGATGCTDVTGFGLLGHLGRMVLESGVDAELDVDATPFLPGAEDLASDGMIPGGTRRNLDWIAEQLDPGTHDELTQLLFADAQTSGGLVFGVEPSMSSQVVDTLAGQGVTAAVIGRTSDGTGRLRLR